MDQQKIGEFLKTLRKDKNLTQEELADERLKKNSLKMGDGKQPS